MTDKLAEGLRLAETALADPDIRDLAVTDPLAAQRAILDLAFGNWQPCHECATPTKTANANGDPACEQHRD